MGNVSTSGSKPNSQGSSNSLAQAKKATDGKVIKPAKEVTAKDGQSNMAAPTSGQKRKAEAELQRGAKRVVKAEPEATVSTTTSTTSNSTKTTKTEAPKSAHGAQAHDATPTSGQKRKAGDELQSEKKKVAKKDSKEKLATKDPKGGMSTPSGKDRVQSGKEKVANKDPKEKLARQNSKDAVSTPSGTIHKAPRNADGAASTQGGQSSKERPGSGQKRKAEDSLQHAATKVAKVAEEAKNGAKATSLTAEATSQASGGSKVTGVAKSKLVGTEASAAIGGNSATSQPTVDPTEAAASPSEPAPRLGWYAETLAKGARARAAWEAKMRRDAETKKDNLSWCLRQAFNIPGKRTRDLTEWEAARRRQEAAKKSRSSSGNSRRGSASSADPSKRMRAQELSRPSSRNSATRPKTKDAAAATTPPGSVVSSKAYRGPVEKEYKGTARVPVRKPEPARMASPVKKKEAVTKEVVAPHKSKLGLVLRFRLFFWLVPDVMLTFK